jgi:hypothetical protein
MGPGSADKRFPYLFTLGQAYFARPVICLGSSMADQNSSGTSEKLIVSLEVNLEPAAAFDIDGVKKRIKASRPHLSVLEIDIHIRACGNFGFSDSEATVITRQCDKGFVENSG